MLLIYGEKMLKLLFAILITVILSDISFCKDLIHLNKDSLINGETDTTISSDQSIDFQTFRILTQLNEEPDFIRDKLYNLQYELGIQKGKELEILEIYIDKTSKDKNLWNVIINDTSLQFLPTLSWNNLTETSRELLDNWSGRNNMSKLTPDDVDTIVTRKNEMFIVKVFPLTDMGEESKLSNIQREFTYEIFIMDDYPEQVEIAPKKGLIIKRVDKNRFRIKLSVFTRASFERWAESRNDNPYVYTTSIVVYDKVTNQKAQPINLRFSFGEY